MLDATGRKIRVGDRISRARHNSGGAYHEVGVVCRITASPRAVYFAVPGEPERSCTLSKLMVVLARDY